MKVITKYLKFSTNREGEMLDITKKVQEIIDNSQLKNGIVTVFVPGSTGAITTIEYEAGLLRDFPELLEKIAPKKVVYKHDNRWHDGNGRSHVKASLIGPSITIPIINNKLALGTWQQLSFIELDIRNRNRTLIIQIMGE